MSLRELAELKERVSIEEVLEHYGGEVFTGWNGWRRARCPFHDDRVPSASVGYGRYICHAGCVQGDIFDIVQYAEDLPDLHEAVEFVRRTFCTDDE